jgi:hypothetical protein
VEPLADAGDEPIVTGMERKSPWRRPLLWLALVALALGIFFVGFAAGFNIGQPSLVAESAGEVRAAAEALDQIALEAQRDPRGVGDQLTELRTRLAAIRDRTARDAALTRLDAIEQRLREQNDRLESALWTTHEKASRVRRDLDARLDASSGLWVTGYDQIKRFLNWLGPVVVGTALIILGLFAFPGTRRWLAKAQSFSLGGFAINIHDPSSVREGVSARFQQVDDAIAEAYLDKLELTDVDGLFVSVKQDLDAQFSAIGIDLRNIKHRATLWVPGFIGNELVQAARYVGNMPPSTRPVIGRRFSVRYGIIGRAWRLGATQYNWDVNNKANALIRQWGLTRGEAGAQGIRDSSLMAFVIANSERNTDPLGVVYLEAEGINVLLPKQIPELEKRIPGDPNGRRIADKDADELIWQPLWDTHNLDLLVRSLRRLRSAFSWDSKVAPYDGR